MANYLKYRIDFTNAQDYACTVDLYLKDYAGPVSYLTGGTRAFVLREFNTDLDFYKPLRPQQAEIEILADSVSIDEFIGQEDDTWLVIFSIDGHEYWRGWLLQDDFQENWIDTAHIITLRAHEGIGNLKDINLTYQAGQQTIWSYIDSALQETTQQTAIGTYIVNDLYYPLMDDLSDGNYFGMQQTFIENQTFSTGVNTFDDYNTILEKILRAWNCTLFQYKGLWWVFRQSLHLFGLSMYEYLRYRILDGNQGGTQSYSVNIGVDEDIKPIMPEMLRTVSRMVKTNKITMKYEYPAELICNEGFRRGTKFYDSSIRRKYSIDCWTKYKRAISSSAIDFFDLGTAATNLFYRDEELDTDGKVTDDFVVMESEGAAVWAWAESETSLFLNKGDKITFELDHYYDDTAVTNVAVFAVWLRSNADSEYYWLGLDGTWNKDGRPDKRNTTAALYNDIRFGETKPISVTSLPAPELGEISFVLINPSEPDSGFGDSTFPRAIFSNLKVTVESNIKRAVGDWDKYEQNITSNSKYEDEIYLDDLDTPAYKGALFFPEGTLTGDRWYRYGYDEALTFKRQKALAHWQFNKRYRQKLDVNMFGLMWDDNGVNRPIGLHNEFVFVDDAPTKKFCILNLQEMDFVNATWKATLIEVYDSEIDTAEELVNYPTHSYDYIFE